ncbi:MAG: NUDIX hydrolase, partial [Okeania sp. SIO2D1]|nr:NUDIX hydrolase [Okeania sp. SIO2D1]
AWNNLWHIPGGTVFYQEYIEDAIQRIAVEELSITVTKQQLLGYLEYPSEEKQRGFGWSVGLVFLCTPNSPFPTENQEGEKIKIFDYVPENTVEEHKKMLTQVLSI